MTSVVLVPDGIGVRNFILSPFLKRQAAAGDVHVVHQIPSNLLPMYQAGLQDVHWHEFSPYRETPASFTLRYGLAYAQMYWADTKSMRYHLRRVSAHGSWRTKAADRAARVLGRLAASPAHIKRLERWHCAVRRRKPEVDRWKRLFEQLKPSVLFCSHQRPPIILPAVLAARECGLPTATFIFSWDNMTSKGRIAVPFDHYLVWSDLMRQELLRYYPDVAANQVHIVGTPQFDPYADESVRWSRDEFFSRIDGDPNRPLICFSGNNSVNGKEDPHQLRVLLEFIRSGRVKANPQVVLRPAPTDSGRRFDALRRDYPELLYAPPAWTNQRDEWDQVLPEPHDIPLLANLILHSDLNVNFGSTMTLDFAVHDKPVVNAAFDVTSPYAFGMPCYDYCMQYDHYRPVAELQSSRFARTEDQLAEYVNLYLANPAIDREGRRRLVELEVSGPIGSSTERITNVLSSVGRMSMKPRTA